MGGARLSYGFGMLLEGDCSHIGVLVYYGALPVAVLTKLTMIPLFLILGSFEHAWELGSSDGFDYMHFGLMQRRQIMSGAHSFYHSGDLGL